MPRTTKARRAYDAAYWEGLEAGVRYAMQGVYRTEDSNGNPHKVCIAVIPGTLARPQCVVVHDRLPFYPLMPRDAAKLFCELMRSPAPES